MSTATESPGVNPVPGAVSGVDLATVAEERRYRPNPADVQRLAPNRDERLFLVLSIFIGVLSGLLVVCFRVAISWIQVLTLGSAPHPGQLRLFFVPMGVGLLVAALVQLVFPAARGSGINHSKRVRESAFLLDTRYHFGGVD